ncbi:hypothetical protein CBR_g50304 [Chara braunii]|uniref:Hemimethylated DNA-binding domain-containing protein n=1 Tax=Chara braunii TaxID=69332 RepID=A0A388K5C7_CHABU|nr:hypothetical protein CBR_g50304 [Chara braunii]|eukprot:GBG65262.1 hypothetical protein CBR_g50304 [Chara braunii]
MACSVAVREGSTTLARSVSWEGLAGGGGGVSQSSSLTRTSSGKQQQQQRGGSNRAASSSMASCGAVLLAEPSGRCTSACVSPAGPSTVGALRRTNSLPSANQCSFAVDDVSAAAASSAIAGVGDLSLSTTRRATKKYPTCPLRRAKSLQDLVGAGLSHGIPSTSPGQVGFVERRRKVRVWRMEMASDPLNNCRDSFGNECRLELRARQQLEMSDPYRQVTCELRGLKAALSEAVSKERYEEAVDLRDLLEKLELRKRVLEISAKPHTAYRVGDVVFHRRHGYRGVVYGHDPECSAPEDWQEAMKIDMLPEGRQQPFYHILVDTRDRPGGMSTYVAEESIALQPTPRPVLHPWVSKFFVGFQDGQYMPGKKLRQVYPNDW